MTSQFTISADSTGHGTIVVDGVDLTRNCRGFHLIAGTNNVTRLVLDLNAAGSIEGTGIIEAAQPTSVDVAGAVKSIPPAKIRQKVESNMNNDMSSDPYQAARDAIVEIVAEFQ